MRRAAPIRAVAAGAWMALACAHAPARAPAAPPRTWPEPPAQPRARWAATLPAAGRVPSFWGKLGRWILGSGADAGEKVALQRPFGVAVRGDAVWIADPDAPGVFRIGREGALERVSCERQPWSAPMAVAVAPDGAAWVADAGAGVLVRIVPQGGCAFFGEGQLQRPTGIVVAAGRVYVVDPPAHQVVAFETDGRVALRIGEPGDGDGQLDFPSGIGVDAAGRLLVVDALNFRIARFSADGKWLGSFGERGDEGGELARPKAVAVDGGGRTFVSDAQRSTVLVYSPDDRFEFAVGDPGAAPGELVLPAGVTVDGRRLFVADSGNRRVEVYELLGDVP